ncbi:hypothetical protein OEZ86_010165 [Tetradesmus obliquus]|nr:hypothetical protein OEZ86_010165 [Tetradesmus obliquus]
MAEHEVEEREERLLSSEEGDDEEAVPSTVRIAKLLEQGRSKELRTAFSALQSEVKAVKAELKLAEQTAGIATRDYNELWERHQQQLQELSEAQARLVEGAEELEQAKELLQQQKDETAAAGTRVDNLRVELAGSVEELQEKVQVLSGKALASALARPETFDGKDLLTGKAMQGQKVVQWTTAVKRYCQALKLSPSQHVSVAVSLLRGAAAQAWTSAEAVLLGNNTEITLEHVRECLLKRFTPAATAHTVRTALDQLKQQGQYASIAAYVTQFDALCSQLPKIAEEERCHRFITGLQQSVVKAVCVDPATNELFTDYERMRHSALTYAATSAGFLDIVGQAAGETGSRMDKFKRQKTGNRQPQQGGGGAGSSGAGSSGAGGSSLGGSGAAGQRGNASQPGWAPRRSKEHFAYLQTKKKCARCFGDKHDYKACKAPVQPANAVPPGFGESG